MIDYIKDNYGHCKVYDPKVRDSCKCLKGWQGRMCTNWQPVEWNSIEEAIEILKKRKNEQDRIS